MSARATMRLLWGVSAVVVVASAHAQVSVATIRPSRPEEFLSIVVKGREFSATKASLKDLATFAYRLHGRQIIGPEWIENDKFDVVAQADTDGTLSQGDARLMVQQLLADRCSLKFHHGKKSLAVYAIVVANGGPKLTKSSGRSERLRDSRLPRARRNGRGQL